MLAGLTGSLGKYREEPSSCCHLVLTSGKMADCPSRANSSARGGEKHHHIMKEYTVTVE